MKKYLENVDIECWRHVGGMGPNDPYVCLFILKPQSCEPLLLAIILPRENCGFGGPAISPVHSDAVNHYPPGVFPMTRRIAFGCLVLVVALLPMVAAWLMMIAMIPSPEAETTPVATPNPAMAPASALSAVEILVYADPWFAGTISIWLAVWLPVLVSYSIFATCADARRRRASMLAVASFLLGTAFAAPWICGLYRIFTEG